MNYIIAYDIEKQKARTKVSKKLEAFGVRVQLSVFDCEISKKELKTLKNEIENLINNNTDSIMFIHNCKSCEKKREFIGTPFIKKKISIIEI